MIHDNEDGDGNFGHPVYHIAFLHNKLRKRVEDRYVVDIALLLKNHGHKVVIYTSEFDPNNCLDEVNVSSSKFDNFWFWLETVLNNFSH